jgi:hypothetical protein
MRSFPSLTTYLRFVAALLHREPMMASDQGTRGARSGAIDTKD